MDNEMEKKLKNDGSIKFDIFDSTPSCFALTDYYQWESVESPNKKIDIAEKETKA